MSVPSGNDHKPLAAHVVHDPDDRRMDRQWAEILARVGPKRSRWGLALYPAFAALIVLIALQFVWRSHPVSASLEGTTLEGVGAGQVITLADGAEVRLEDRTLLRVSTWTDQHVAMIVERGAVTFDVPHLEGRSWSISAGAFDIRIVGTRFVVKHELGSDGEIVSVDVLRGRVEVVRRDGTDPPRILAAGESWRAGGLVGMSPLGSASASAAAIPAPDAPDAAPTSSETATALVAPPPPSWEEQARARHYKEAYETLGADGFSRELGASDAEKLFRLAEVARSSGHLRDAERAFDRLRRQFRGDPRAGLSAFELGRLRLDSLHNPSGAAEALTDAITLSPGASFREDAEARRVQALDSRASVDACTSARDGYLARYPSGAYAAVVRSRCQAK